MSAVTHVIRPTYAMSQVLPAQASTSLCHRIKGIWNAFLGSFLRVFVFHIAAAQTFGSRLIYGFLHMNCHKTVYQGAIDLKRVKKLEDHMKALGAEISIAKTAKGHPIQYALLKFANFKQQIERAGGKLILKEGVHYICPPKKTNPGWTHLASSLRSFANGSMHKIGWQEEANGVFTLGQAANAKEGTCLLRCRGPGGVYEARRFIAGYLGSGIDLCLFNWPGAPGSRGEPSEGANYAAGEGVYQMLIKKGYEPKKIFASGFCLGAATAVKLYKDHSHEGLNLIVENGFTSMPKMIDHLTYNMFGYLGTTTLQAEGYRDQDGFNSVAKLASIPQKGKGSISIVSTENDKTVPPDSYSSLMKLAHKCSHKVHTLVWKHPKAKGHDAHIDEPLHMKDNWRGHLAWF